MRKRTVATLLTTILLMASACSASVSVGGSDSVDKADLEKKATAFLEDQGVTAGFTVSCPEDLQGETGAKVTCTIAYDNGDEQDLFISETSVDDSGVNFHMETGEVADGTGGGGTDTGS